MKKIALGSTLVLSLFGCGPGQIVDPSGAGDGGASPSGGAGLKSSGGVSAGGTSSGEAGAPSVASGGVEASGGVSNVSSGGASSAGTATAGNAGASCGTTIPAIVQGMLSGKCSSCHGASPLPGLPALVTYAELTASGSSNPTKTNAQLAAERIQSTSSLMPPAPGTPASSAEVSALNDWIASGYVSAPCPTGSGGAGGMGGTDPFSVASVCTSNSRWTDGNEGSRLMNPGMACVSCHASTGGEAPSYSVAGTIYPTGHEPDLCNGAPGSPMASKVVIVGADGVTLTLSPNGAGNFYSETRVRTPYRAKVTYDGRERIMIAEQTSGDCNSCHTKDGANGAPGRIVLP